MTGPALKPSLVVARVAIIRPRFRQPCLRSQGHRMRLVTIAALWNILRLMGHIAVRARFFTAWHGIAGGRGGEFIERSVTAQAGVLGTSRLWRRSSSRRRHIGRRHRR